MADLSVTVNGMKFPNPFVLGSGPPGTNAKVINRSFSLGWGGIACKTISLDNSKVHNVAPRYARLKSRTDGSVIGFENIELISDRTFEQWLDEGDPVPASERAALAARDLHIRRTIAERDPANILATKLYGEAMKDELVEALWGKNRQLPRPI